MLTGFLYIPKVNDAPSPVVVPIISGFNGTLLLPSHSLITKDPITFSQEKVILIPLIADMGKYLSAHSPSKAEHNCTAQYYQTKQRKIVQYNIFILSEQIKNSGDYFHS